MALNLAAQQPWYMGQNGATELTRGEAARRARRYLESPDYEAQLEIRIKSGSLPAAVECMLWHFAYGKPVDQIQLNVGQRFEDLSQLPLSELRNRADQLRQHIQQIEDVENAIPSQAVNVQSANP